MAVNQNDFHTPEDGLQPAMPDNTQAPEAHRTALRACGGKQWILVRARLPMKKGGLLLEKLAAQANKQPGHNERRTQE